MAGMAGYATNYVILVFEMLGVWVSAIPTSSFQTSNKKCFMSFFSEKTPALPPIILEVENKVLEDESSLNDPSMILEDRVVWFWFEECSHVSGKLQR